ncbi:hypothetical protein DSCA_27670 [Desulfosarcina alkanivorans]|uniref:Uncharacterized protein n=1 Tax=Desulfosarcina alkanivorans TaxID=571177 RepID=A0A5K7YW01_9BACT|nr:hypothetical protein DSCA_27670 [Desulfosarcina alkanivorans]
MGSGSFPADGRLGRNRKMPPKGRDKTISHAMAGRPMVADGRPAVRRER